ncbi:MAG: cupin domain-containing protein [Alphaproteobacteria bacterium]
MSDQPVLRVERNAFSTMQEAMSQITSQGLWPTTYISTPSPELPVHWHDCAMQGYLVKGDTYILDENNERVDLSAGDKLVIPEGALHAEGTITDEVVYIVGLEDCRPFQHALRMLDPDSYPNPEMLSLDPDFAAELFAALQAAAPPPPPIG